MPVATTYPGVYIEEISSGVHTLTGVSTSITAFVGFTASGSVDTPVHIFSFADFDRTLGGLSADAPMSYAVNQFFQNGGTEAYVVRVAAGAAMASVILQDSIPAQRLTITANGSGTWGNNLQVDVDYDTSNPASLFNLTVREYRLQNGELVPKQTETFRNLSLNPFDPSYVLDTVNGGSQLIQVALTNPLPAPLPAGGFSTSGPISAGDLTGLTSGASDRVAFTVDGRGPFEFALPLPVANIGALATALLNGINSLAGGGSVTQASTATTVTITSTNLTPASSVRFLNTANNATQALHLGAGNGGTEVDGVARFRPQQTGTIGGALTIPFPVTSLGRIGINVRRGTGPIIAPQIVLTLWDAAAAPPILAPATAAELVTRMRAVIEGAGMAEPRLTGARVTLVNGVLRVTPGPADPNINFEFVAPTVAPADTTAASIGLVGATRNVGSYAPGSGLTAFAQVQGAAGNNGAAPGAGQLTGNLAAKTGIYALESVDIFNLLVMPDATAGAGMIGVLTDAIAYCVRRRAFMIIDAPENVSTFQQASTWISGAASPLRNRNAALYFPRLRSPDPMMNNVVRSFPSAGALAGLYARTDSERGVWKAPAGMTALINGATGVSVTLTDPENGNLNPLGLNCIRTFPVIGTVSWGARTARGADLFADEYKYVPVRRLALFLEESLYRGTQWVVFEPNDEPLWSQIRLNLGAFMHTLFAQGAFQGKTPRDAYFVKCDKETTTQNDIDLGRVNIVVGFAPLKPAEFVIIQIQQIAGNILT
ncbi:MAG TPA: phage tail sheath C-terminal domain-containing protein [Gemmatimonadaceae bacterium]|jgi:hypothetical protein